MEYFIIPVLAFSMSACLLNGFPAAITHVKLIKTISTALALTLVMSGFHSASGSNVNKPTPSATRILFLHHSTGGVV